MCIVLDELKNSLLSNAKDICIEILKNELIETLNVPVFGRFIFLLFLIDCYFKGKFSKKEPINSTTT